MRHIISILLQNESGALARVSGMFAARGYNIESLTVAPTQDPALSRLTLVTIGSDAVIDQIVKQSRKLIDVVEVRDITARRHGERELVLVKLRVGAQAAASLQLAAGRRRPTAGGRRSAASGQQRPAAVGRWPSSLRLAEHPPLCSSTSSYQQCCERSRAQ